MVGGLVGIVAGVLALALCSCGTDSATKTSDAIWNASRSATAQKSTLGNLKSTVDGLTPQNLPVEKPKAQTLTGQATQQNADIGKALGLAATGAKKDAAAIKSLSDPVKVRLNWIGIGLIVGGIAAVVAGFFLATYLGNFASIALSVGGASVVTGILTLFVAAFLHTLLWICGGILVVGLVGVGVWAYLHYYGSWSSLWTAIQGLWKAPVVKSPTVG